MAAEDRFYCIVRKRAGADPGFLERGFVCIKVLGGHFADFIIFLNVMLKRK